MKSADVEKGGELRVTHGAGAFSLRLSDRATAEKWALKIRYPKSLFDKLGLQRESCVAVLGWTTRSFSRGPPSAS